MNIPVFGELLDRVMRLDSRMGFQSFCFLCALLYTHGTEAQTNQPNSELSVILDEAWNIRHSEPDSALLLLDQATGQAKSLKDSQAWVTGLLRKGVVLKETGSPKAARPLFMQAEVLAGSMKDSLALGRVFINIGQNEKLLGDFDKAIYFILQAIVIFEKHQKEAYAKVGYASLASTYIQLGKYDKSIAYYEKLRDIALAQQDSVGLATSWQNLGTAYFYNNMPDSALHYQQKSYVFANALQNPIMLAQLNNGIGSSYFEQERPDKALSYFKDAQRQSKELRMPFEEVKALNNIAAVYEVQKNWEQAAVYYHRSKQMAEYLGDQSALKGLFLNLSQTFEAQGRFDSALWYFQLHSNIKDSLINQHSNEQIAEMQEKCESAKKDGEIAELSKVEAQQRADLQRRNFLLAASLLVAILLGIALVNYLSKLRAQKVLAKRTAQLHQQKTMQLINEHSEKSVKAYLQGETAERRRLGEQLHDQLGSQLATVKLYYDSLSGEISDQEQSRQFKRANSLLSQACIDVRQIAHNLASDTLTEFGLEAALANLCNAITESGQLQVRLVCVGLDVRLSATIELLVFRSIQELLTNAIKHSEAQTVQVRIKGEDGTLHVRIKDNGKGFNPELIDAADGLGLQAVSSRIKTLKGQFSISAAQSQGTQIDFQIPLEPSSNS